MRSEFRLRSDADCDRAGPWLTSESPACRCRIAGSRARGTSVAARCSWRRVASPSIVVMRCALRPRPRASGTSRPARPSTITVQAPQSPVRHPSLLPVMSSSSRRTSSRLWRGSHRSSVGSPLIVASTITFFTMIRCPFIFSIALALFALARAFGRDREHAAGQHADDMAAELGRAAHVVDRRGYGRSPARAALSSAASSSFLPISDSDASAAKIGVAATAPGDPRGATRSSSGSSGHRAAHADHRDIHLIARDEAQIGVRECVPGASISNSTSNSPGCSTVRPGAVHKVLDRNHALALGSDHARLARRAQSAPEWRRPRAIRCTDCRRPTRGSESAVRSDQMRRLGQAGIVAPHVRVFMDLDTRDRRAQAQAVLDDRR